MDPAFGAAVARLRQGLGVSHLVGSSDAAREVALLGTTGWLGWWGSSHSPLCTAVPAQEVRQGQESFRNAPQKLPQRLRDRHQDVPFCTRPLEIKF